MMPKSYNYNPYSSPSDAVKAELSEIDASIRAAAIFFVISWISFFCELFMTNSKFNLISHNVFWLFLV